jgi:hypothetical protein
MANPDSSIELPKTSVVCKPSEGAFEQVFKMANINPKKTVRTYHCFFSFFLPKPIHH